MSSCVSHAQLLSVGRMGDREGMRKNACLLSGTGRDSGPDPADPINFIVAQHLTEFCPEYASARVKSHAPRNIAKAPLVTK